MRVIDIVEEKLAWLYTSNLLPRYIIVGRDYYQDFILNNIHYFVSINGRTEYKGVPVIVSLEFPKEIMVSI